MRSQIICVLTLLLLFAAIGNANEHRKTIQRIGNLTVTVLGFEEREARRSPDHHIVVVSLRAENLGKEALCARFHSTLKTTFALQYQAYSYGSSHPFQVSELLPGERTEGDYEFLVKDGVEPLEFDIVPSSQTQTCGKGKIGFSPMLHASQELRFDLKNSSQKP